MPERAKKSDVIRRVAIRAVRAIRAIRAIRMDADETTAAAWVDALIETLYENENESFRAGQSVTLEGLGGFYLRPEPES